VACPSEREREIFRVGGWYTYLLNAGRSNTTAGGTTLFEEVDCSFLVNSASAAHHDLAMPIPYGKVISGPSGSNHGKIETCTPNL
jgi:hypothetical protein